MSEEKKDKKELMAQEIAELRLQVSALRAAVLLRDNALRGALSISAGTVSPRAVAEILKQYKDKE